MPAKRSSRKKAASRAAGNLRSKVTAKMFEASREQQDQPKNAIALLKADHQEATELFEQFKNARSAAQKKTLVGEICLALSVHMRIEEDIFYPAVKKALGGDEDGKELVPEARVEHASLKTLIGQVESAPESEEFEAKVQVMSEYTKHHVQEEEGEMFPKVKSSGLDLGDLGQKMQARKLELLDQVATKASRNTRAPKPSSLFKPAARRASHSSSRSGKSSGSRSHARS